MPELLIITFEHEEEAEQAKDALRSLPEGELLQISDALTIQRDGVNALRFQAVRRNSSVLLSVPRALAASAFAGIYFAAAWAVTAGSMITGAVLRGRGPMKRETAAQLQSHLSTAASALVLIVNERASADMIASLETLSTGKEQVQPGEEKSLSQIIRTPISAENAATLRRELRLAQQAEPAPDDTSVPPPRAHSSNDFSNT